MKKSLLALAVMGAFAGAAQAQSSIQVYGSVDAGVRSSEAANGDRTLGMDSSGTYNSNRLGFRGTEDLGGGLNARFLLEARFRTGTGTLGQGGAAAASGLVPSDRGGDGTQLFNGNSYVGLGGSWGTVDLGRQYTPSFDVIGTYDPFNYKYTGLLAPVQQNGGLTRFNNSVKYRGNFGPASVIVAHALGEQPDDRGAGASTAVGATFGTGPFNVGAAYTTRANLNDTGDQKTWTLGGAFKTGPARVAVGYINDDRDAGFAAAGQASREQKTAWVGASYAVTPAVELTAALYRWNVEQGATVDTRTNQFMLGSTYALSKRTNLYAEYDFLKTKGTGATTTNRLDNFSVGLNHLF